MDPKLFGKRLAQAIEDAGYESVNAFSKVDGTPSQSTLAALVAGETANPETATIHKLATHLNVSIAWLMGEDIREKPEYRQGWRDAILEAERTLRTIEKPPKDELDEGDPIPRPGGGRKKK